MRPQTWINAPCCFLIFFLRPAAVEGRHNILVAAHDSSLMVLRDNKMIWAAQMDCIPVAVRVCKLGFVRLCCPAEHVSTESGFADRLFMTIKPPQWK